MFQYLKAIEMNYKNTINIIITNFFITSITLLLEIKSEQSVNCIGGYRQLRKSVSNTNSVGLL